jgi:thioredoxin-related protein
MAMTAPTLPVSPGWSRQRFLLAMGLAWASSCGLSLAQSGHGSADHRSLPAAQSLPDELARALAQKSPLVVMVSLEGCPHCRVARQSHLLPMWRDWLPIVQVDMRSERALTDFQGRVRSHDDMVRQWRVSIAPTLLFFGPAGREVADRMEGGYLPDFYRAYLEQRLAQARQQW